MSLQKLPTANLDDINHRRRRVETLNKVLDHSFDDSRVRNAAEIAAGVTPINPAYPPGQVQRYGVIGDGSTDDSDAMVVAISTGLALDLGNLTIRIVTKLTFDQEGQHIYAAGGGFVFDGLSTTRLADITAEGVEFNGVDFDCNSKQIKGAMLYVASDAALVRFTGCKFRRINGTHVGGVTGTDANIQYAIAISPYGVEGFEIGGCVFDDIKNDNSGENGVSPATGLGFCGGVFFLTDNWAEPTTVQTTYTSGVIRDCTFRNIRTILDTGLSENDYTERDDADGVRFYGNTTGLTRLPVTVERCTFIDVSKRAVKNSVAAATVIRDITVIATGNLQYPMKCAVKVDGDDQTVDGVKVYSPSGAAIRRVIQSHDCSFLTMNDVVANRSVVFWDVAPTSTSVVSTGWRISNLRGTNIETFGIRTGSSGLSYVDCRFDGLYLEAPAAETDVPLIEFSATSDRMEVHFSNSQIINGDNKGSGYGWSFTNCYQEIDNASYAGASSTRSMFEWGLAPGTGVTRNSVIDGYELNVKDLPDGYLTASRPYLWLLFGDRLKVSRLRVTVPEALATVRAHGSFDGSDACLEEFEYSGQGFIYLGVTFSGTTKERLCVRGAKRIGGDSADTEFLVANHCSKSTISDVDDYRDAAGGSITIAGGTVGTGDTDAYIIEGVRSRTSGTPVTDGGALARQVDVGVF